MLEGDKYLLNALRASWKTYLPPILLILEALQTWTAGLEWTHSSQEYHKLNGQYSINKERNEGRKNERVRPTTNIPKRYQICQ